MSSVIGVDTRNTVDVDFYLTRVFMEKEKIIKLIKDIASIDIDDGIEFEVIGVSNIRENDIEKSCKQLIFIRLKVLARENQRFCNIIVGDDKVMEQVEAAEFVFQLLVTQGKKRHLNLESVFFRLFIELGKKRVFVRLKFLKD